MFFFHASAADHFSTQVIIKTMIAGHAAMRQHYRLYFPRTADANCCFQILGFDIMYVLVVTDDGHKETETATLDLTFSPLAMPQL